MSALLVPSGNDAAVAIAETVGALMDPEDGYDAFVAAMNAKAAELGCVDTVFTNPARARLWRGSQATCTAARPTWRSWRAMRHEGRHVPRHRGAGRREHRGDRRRRHGAASWSWSPPTTLIGTYEGACGIKTGLTDRAGASFAGACTRDGRTLYAVVINSTSEEQRFADATALYDWVFEHEVDYPLAHSPQTTTATLQGQTRQVPVIAEVAHAGWIDATVKVDAGRPGGEREGVRPERQREPVARASTS